MFQICKAIQLERMVNDDDDNDNDDDDDNRNVALLPFSSVQLYNGNYVTC